MTFRGDDIRVEKEKEKKKKETSSCEQFLKNNSLIVEMANISYLSFQLS